MTWSQLHLASDPATWKDSSNDGSYGELVWIATTPPLSDASVLGVAGAQTFYTEKVKIPKSHIIQNNTFRTTTTTTHMSVELDLPAITTRK